MDILHLLSVAYGGDKEERAAATAQLEQALQSQEALGYVLTLLRAGTNPALPPQQSLQALICAKNHIISKLDEVDTTGSPGALEEIQSLLYNGMFKVPQTHQNIICACVSTLVSVCNWDYLPQLMSEIAGEGLANASADHLVASVRLLYVFLKPFKTPYLKPMNVKLTTCSMLMVPLSQFLSKGDLRVGHFALKAMECVVETVLHSNEENNIPADVFDKWFNDMVGYPECRFTAIRETGAAGSQKDYDTYVRCIRRIAMISSSMLRDATKKNKPIPVAKHFLITHAVSFFGVWLRWLEYSATSKERSVHLKADIHAIQYLKLSASSKSLYEQYILPHTMQIIETVLFPYLCYNEDDDAILSVDGDIAEFAQYMMEGTLMGSETSARDVATSAILALVRARKNFQHNLLPQILQTVVAGLSQSDTPETLPQKFGFLHLLAAMRKDLRGDKEIWVGQVAHMLVTLIGPRMLPTTTFFPLRYKALVVYQRYAKAPMDDGNFASFMELIASMVQDQDPRVRLIVIDTMCTILEMKRALPFILPVLGSLVDECIAFLNRVQTTFVPSALLYLVDNFTPELMQVLDKMSKEISRSFLAAAFDMAQMEDAVDKDSLQNYMSMDTGACALLDALDTIAGAAWKDEKIFSSIKLDLLQVIKSIMAYPDNYEYMDKALSIWLVAVSTKPITAEWWEVLPLLFRSIESGVGVDFFGSIEEVLDNYISNGTVEYIGNRDLMEATYQACEKILFDCANGMSDQVGVPQLIEALLHQAKHCEAASELFDPYLPRFVVLLLRALASDSICSGEVRLKVWMVAALMDAFYYNPGHTLQIMVESNAYPQFFDMLFHFFRPVLSPPGSKKKGKKDRGSEAQEVKQALSALTRKVIVLGLTSLLVHLTATTSGAALGNVSLDSFKIYLHPTLALIQYCIFSNSAMMEKRCRLTEESIAKMNQGVEAEDAEEGGFDDELLGWESADEDEPDSFNVRNGGDDVLSDSDDVFDPDIDEGDEYTSPIDDVCEVTFFLQWLSQLRVLGPNSTVEQFVHTGLSRSADEFRAAEVTALRYRQLVQQLNRALEEENTKRQHRAAIAGPVLLH
ncbi:hypothetical protein TRVL_01356 [Trypanosoma vivax]|nr:hypothetical protein TRVL_01356 [Trypanosoma vivax]